MGRFVKGLHLRWVFLAIIQQLSWVPFGEILSHYIVTGLSQEDGGRASEVTRCGNVPIFKNECKYRNEKCIHEIFDPSNMHTGTTFMMIGPKLMKLLPFWLILIRWG